MQRAESRRRRVLVSTIDASLLCLISVIGLKCIQLTLSKCRALAYGQIPLAFTRKVRSITNCTHPGLGRAVEMELTF